MSNINATSISKGVKNSISSGIGAAKFNIENIKLKMSSLDGTFEEFGNTTVDLSSIVRSLINEDPNKSAIFGNVGEILWNIWDKNASTFDEFKENFKQWSEAVSVISATNSKFMVDIDAIYRDSAGTMTKVIDTGKAYKSGTLDIKELSKTSNFYANVEANQFIDTYGLESDGSVGWLKKYEGLSDDARDILASKSVDNFVEKYGTEQIGSEEWNGAYNLLTDEQKEYAQSKYMEKYGIDITDSNVVSSLDNNIQGESTEQSNKNLNSSSSINKSNIDSNLENNIQDDGIEQSNNSTTSSVTDSAQYNRGDIVKVGNKTLSYYGTTDNGINLFKNNEDDYLYYLKDDEIQRSNVTEEGLFNGSSLYIDGNEVKPALISSSVKYGDASQSNMEYITSLDGSPSNGNTYYVGNDNLKNSATHITSADGNELFAKAISNHENIYVDAGATVKVDPSGIFNTETLSDGRNPTYLVFDNETGKYYVTDSNGTYSTTNSSYSPDDFLKDDGGLHF